MADPTIMFRIKSAIDMFITQRMTEPRVIILGKNEWWEMVRWTHDRGVYLSDNMTTATFGPHYYVKTIWGIRVVYDIDTESCLDIYG